MSRSGISNKQIGVIDLCGCFYIVELADQYNWIAQLSFI